jgi:hypothetical protein
MKCSYKTASQALVQLLVRVPLLSVGNATGRYDSYRWLSEISGGKIEEVIFCQTWRFGLHPLADFYRFIGEFH